MLHLFYINLCFVNKRLMKHQWVSWQRLMNHWMTATTIYWCQLRKQKNWVCCHHQQQLFFKLNCGRCEREARCALSLFFILFYQLYIVFLSEVLHADTSTPRRDHRVIIPPDVSWYQCFWGRFHSVIWRAYPNFEPWFNTRQTHFWQCDDLTSLCHELRGKLFLSIDCGGLLGSDAVRESPCHVAGVPVFCQHQHQQIEISCLQTVWKNVSVLVDLLLHVLQTIV